MNDEQRHLLALCSQAPARLSVEQTAWLLNFQPHDIPILVAARLLKPLGNPPACGVKFFATVEILQLARDPGWLARATNAIYQHWHRKNSRRKNRPRPPPDDDSETPPSRPGLLRR